MNVTDNKTSELSNKEKFDLIKSVGEECIDDAVLNNLLDKNIPLVAYDGFEPSGNMHIAQSVMRTMNVNKLTKAGCKFIFWVADWFAMLNHKFGGDLKKIKTAGELMIEVWKACGMDMTNVEFRWASDEINKNGGKYLETVLDVSTKFSLARATKCTQALGRNDENLSMSQIFYVAMQCADIFFLKVNICSLGMDQRKVNMLAIEYAEKSKKHKPVVISHHMLLGLDGTKMSKSSPDNAIFVNDSDIDINRKIKQAFCEEGNVEKNPILEYCKYIIFEKESKVSILRDEKYGGNMVYHKYADLENDFKDKKIHPGDLKKAVALSICSIIGDVRTKLAANPKAQELLKKVKIYMANQAKLDKEKTIKGIETVKTDKE